MEILDQIPVSLDVAQVMARLRNLKGLEDCVAELLGRVRQTARPKAAYATCYVEAKGPDWVVVDGVQLSSQILRVNLDPVRRVFPYVATCGTEVDTIQVAPDDVMAQYCLDLIKRMLVSAARVYLEAQVARRFGLDQLSRMGPGSLEDWPITQQQPLFSLLGDVEGAIGVRLTESFLMVPLKSVSGLFFPTETKWENCQLCPRPVCEGRRAPYEATLAEDYSRRTAT